MTSLRNARLVSPWVALAGILLLAHPPAAAAAEGDAKAPDWPNLLSEAGRRAAMALPPSSPWHLEATLGDREDQLLEESRPMSAKERYEHWLTAAGTPPNVRANDPAADQLNPADTQSECAVAAWRNNVVAAWNDSKGLRLGPPTTVSGYAYSTDGGLTWTDGGSVPLLNASDQAYGDCTLDVDDAGNFYLSHIYVNSVTGTQDVAVHRGTFSGSSFSWNPPVTAASGASGALDKPYVCVNPVDGNVYISYTRFGATTNIEVVRGTALGTTWTGPVVLDTSSGSQASRPFVGPEGNLYVCWAAGWGSILCDMSSTTGTIKFRRSTNPAGAFTFLSAVTAGTVNQNWTSYWGGNLRASGHYMPDMGVDRSGGPNNGNIYIAWNEAAPWGAPSASGSSTAETEPNSTPTDAGIKTIAPGDNATGTISSSGDWDYWKISLTAGQHLLMRLEPQGFNCGISSTIRNFQLRVYSGANADTLLTQSNLNGFASEVVFDVPQTGTYFFRVRNQNASGVTTGTYTVKSRLLNYGTPSPARDMRDIVLVRSTNLGVSFSAEMLVNDDAADLDNCIPALSVDALGKVNVFYYDCRDANATRALRSYYRNVSFDGAATWQPGHRISDELMYFNLNTVAIPNYGEYNQACTARGFPAGTNVVYSSWSDERLTNAATPAGSGIDCYIAKMQSCVTVLCAPDQTAASGDVVGMNLCIDNCGNFADDIDYTITDSQGWCTPLSGSVNVSASGSTCIPVNCTVPGATPDGTQSVITLIASARSCPAAADTCTTTITVQNLPLAGMDCFQSTASVQVEIFGVGTTTIGLSGPTMVKRKDPVPSGPGYTIDTEMVQLDLTGTDPTLGPVVLRESPLYASNGQIATGAFPYFPAESFFDVFFEMDVMGMTLYNKDRLHVAATINAIPPVGDPYQGDDILLYKKGATGNWNPVGRVLHVIHTPGTPFEWLPPAGSDCLQTTIGMVVDVTGLGTDNLTGTGPMMVTRGPAIDPGDGRPEIQTEIVSMDLTGTGALVGNWHLIEPPSTPSLGQIKSQSITNLYPVDSFFDVYFELELTGLGKTAVPVGPVNMRAVLDAIPPLGTTYLNTASVQLIDKNTLAPLGTLQIVQHTPTAELEWAPPAAVDCFNSTAQLSVEIFGTGTDQVQLAGATMVARGPAADVGGGQLEIDTEMLSMELAGTSPLFGPVTVQEDVDKPSTGKVDGLSPGVMFPADSFFDVWIVVETPAGVLRSAVPVHMANPALPTLPPPPGTQYQATNTPIDLVTPSGVVLGRLHAAVHDVGQPIQWTTDTPLDAGSGSFFGFRSAYPNPFTGRTTVGFRLDRERMVRMRVYNVRGELVRIVQDGRLGAGLRILEWDGKDQAGYTVGTGVYFYRLEIDQKSLTRKVVRMP